MTEIEDYINKLILSVNCALVDINGRKNLPISFEKYVNSSLDTISADTLQGVKICAMYLKDKLRSEENESQDKVEDQERKD